MIESPFSYVRKAYSVPAEMGRRIRYSGDGPAEAPKEGTIVGYNGAYLEILLDGDKKPGLYHPTWELIYLEEVKPVKFKPSRYADYLRSESSLTFAEWMGIEVPQLEFQGGWSILVPRCRMYAHRDGIRIQGEWKRTMKDAKASYKAALARHKETSNQARREGF